MKGLKLIRRMEAAGLIRWWRNPKVGRSATEPNGEVLGIPFAEIAKTRQGTLPLSVYLAFYAMPPELELSTHYEREKKAREMVMVNKTRAVGPTGSEFHAVPLSFFEKFWRSLLRRHGVIPPEAP